MLHKKTWVETSLQTAWDFIKNPANLNLLTPDDMDFNIVSNLPENMQEGMLIQYQVKLPLLGNTTWVSRLQDIVPNHSFVDEQVKGPYKYWHHHHVIEPHRDGVIFTDKVSYIPPLGPLGKLANALYISRKLEEIFEYREARLNEVLS